MKKYKNNFFKMDFLLLFLMFIFIIFGCVMILSASSVAAVLRYYVSAEHFFFRQVLFSVGSIIVGFIFVINIETKRYPLIGYGGMLLAIIGLLGLSLYGAISNGAQSWYDFGIASLQPSEFAKSALIFFSGVFYYQYQKKIEKGNLLSLIPLGVGCLLFLLVALQPDLGGALIILGMAYLMFLSVRIGNEWRKKVTVLGIGFVAVILFFVTITGNNLLDEHQIARFDFFNPCEQYLEVSGYQVCNGFIAINNGGWTGVGLGESTQKYLYLPEAHTDFIFPIVIEELGLIIGILIIMAYLVLLLRVLKVAREASNIQNSVIAYGVFIYITAHILINLMGVLGLMPLTGVPLPFLSYGGSYAINLILMLFVIQRIAIENKIDRQNRELAKL